MGSDASSLPYKTLTKHWVHFLLSLIVLGLAKERSGDYIIHPFKTYACIRVATCWRRWCTIGTNPFTPREVAKHKSRSHVFLSYYHIGHFPPWPPLMQDWASEQATLTRSVLGHLHSLSRKAASSRRGIGGVIVHNLRPITVWEGIWIYRVLNLYMHTHTLYKTYMHIYMI